MHLCAHLQTHKWLLFIESGVKLSSSEERWGSQVLKPTGPCVKDILMQHVQVCSGDCPVRGWPGYIAVFSLDEFVLLLVQKLQESICVLCCAGLLKSSMKFSGFVSVQKFKGYLWSKFVSQILKYNHSVYIKLLDCLNTFNYDIFGDRRSKCWILPENFTFFSAGRSKCVSG